MHHDTYTKDILWTIGYPREVGSGSIPGCGSAFRLVRQGERVDLPPVP